MFEHITGADAAADDDAVITVAVRTDVCKIRAAALLRDLAERLAAEHGPGLCTPAPAQQRPREDAPAGSSAGRLDRARGVWHDPRGESWDLTLTWADWFEREWRWHGTLGRSGEPVMRAEDNGEALPFDLLRELYAPLNPVMGGAA